MSPRHIRDVIPAQAGRHPRAGGDPRKVLRGTVASCNHLAWVPAFAGMTLGNHTQREEP